MRGFSSSTSYMDLMDLMRSCWGLSLLLLLGRTVGGSESSSHLRTGGGSRIFEESVDFANETRQASEMSYVIASTTNRTQCESDVATVLTPIYKGVITGEVLASSLALWPNLVLLCVVWRVTVLPVNLRLLLWQFSFLLVWLTCGNIIKEGYLLGSDPCAFRIDQRGCKIFDLLASTLPLATVNYTLLALCVERMTATLAYRHYDRVGWHTRPYLAIILVFISQLAAILVNGINVLQLATDQLMPICETHFMISTSPQYLSTVYLGMEFAAAAFVLFIYAYNRCIARSMAINRARYNLAARFLIDQNVQINAIIAPTMILHFLAHIPSFTINSFQKTMYPDLDIGTKSWLGRVTVLLRLIYAFFHPLLAFHFNAHLRKQLLEHSPVGRLLRRLGVRGTSIAKIQDGGGGGNDADGRDGAAGGRHANKLVVHFDHLDKIWTLTKPLTKAVAGTPKTAWSEPQTGAVTPVSNSTQQKQKLAGDPRLIKQKSMG